MIGGIKETQDMLDFCAKHGITCPHEKITADAEKVNAAYERTVKSDVKPPGRNLENPPLLSAQASQEIARHVRKVEDRSPHAHTRLQSPNTFSPA